MTYLTHQMKGLEDASCLKVSHPEYVDFNSDEDDLLGDDDLLVDNSSDETMMNLLLIMLIKIKRMTMIRRRLSI